MSLSQQNEHGGWQQRIDKETDMAERFMVYSEEMKDRSGRVLPQKLIPGGLTLGKATQRFMMVDGSATNLQDPSTMVDHGQVMDKPTNQKYSSMDDNQVTSLPIVTKAQVAQANKNNQDAARAKDRMYERRRMDLMQIKMRLLKREKEKLARAISTDRMWTKATSKTDTGLNSIRSDIIVKKAEKIIQDKLKDIAEEKEAPTHTQEPNTVHENASGPEQPKEAEKQESTHEKRESETNVQEEFKQQPNSEAVDPTQTVGTDRPKVTIDEQTETQPQVEIQEQPAEPANDEAMQYQHDHEIKTTSTLKSKLKGLETKERIKLLMKRSMSQDQLKKAKKELGQSLNEACNIPALEVDITPEKRIKSDLSKLNQLNNPISKQIDEDAVSVHSRQSKGKESNQSIASDSKISNYVRMLKNEIEKEKSAKDNALSILKSLKKKDKDVDHVINTLSN